MSGQFPMPVKEFSDFEVKTRTFGPYAAANFASTDNVVRLPIMFERDAVVHEMSVQAGTRSSVDDVGLTLMKGAINATTKVVTAHSGTVAASPNNRVSSTRNIGDGTTTNQVGITNNRKEQVELIKGFGTGAAIVVPGVEPGDQVFTGGVVQGPYENIIEAGNELYLHTDLAATDLAGLYVHLVIGYRKA